MDFVFAILASKKLLMSAIIKMIKWMEIGCRLMQKTWAFKNQDGIKME